jgi:hypothetical protein
MPQLLILVAAGAGLFLAGRWYRDVQRRIASELRAAEEALQRREQESVVPLEQDPTTGVYRPRRVAQRAETTRH